MKHLLVILSLGLFFSCKKDSTPIENYTNPVYEDTLSIGWSRTLSNEGVTDVYFVDPMNGTAITDRRLLKSGDGGISWDSIGRNSGYYNIAMASPDKFLFIGDKIKSTINGGTNFIENSEYNFTDGCYASDGKCFVAGTPGLFSTDNNGATLNRRRSLTRVAQTCVYFLNSSYGWVSTSDSIHRTTDGGNTWLSSRAPEGGFVTLDFITPNVGFCNSSGRVYKTVDGGNQWLLIGTLSITGSYSDIDFINENVGYANAGRVLYKTVNGGQTWSTELISRTVMVEIHFTDQNHGWVCDGYGIFRYKL